MNWSQRARGSEFMDDLTLSGASLRAAVRELAMVNRFLGGYSAIERVLGPFAVNRRLTRMHVLDLGSGLADVPARLVRWGAARGIQIRVTALEGNLEIVQEANRYLDDVLPGRLRPAVQVVYGDVWNLSEHGTGFDVVTASLFLHHMEGPDVIKLLHYMHSHARCGIIVNDLHRHWLAYQGIRILSRIMRTSDTFRHDGPLSVRRGFRRKELEEAAVAAGLDAFQVRWHWAFRWTLSTLM